MIDFTPKATNDMVFQIILAGLQSTAYWMESYPFQRMVSADYCSTESMVVEKPPMQISSAMSLKL